MAADNLESEVQTNAELTKEPTNAKNDLPANLSSSSSQKLILPALVVIITLFLIVIILLVLLLTNTNKGNNNSTIPTTTITPTTQSVITTVTPTNGTTVTPTINPTASWVAVSRPKIDFKMPAEYGWGECPDGDLIRIGPKTSDFHKNQVLPVCADDYIAPINIFLGNSVLTLPTSDETYDISEVKNIKVDNIDAIYYKSTIKVSGGMQTIGDYQYLVIIPSKSITIDSKVNLTAAEKQYFDLFLTTIKIKF